MSNRPRLLDLFCGAGGCAAGYARAGFEVHGVDIKAQPRYLLSGAATFTQADALEYLAAHGREFDVIHASPPCQRYSIGTRRWAGRAATHPDLIAPTRDLLMERGRPWIVENVVGAPLQGPILLCGTMFGLRVFRHRLFESSVFLMTPAHPGHVGSTGAHRGYSTSRSGRNGFLCIAGHNFEMQAGAAAMGIDWMVVRRELSQAIPPAYTEYLGRQLYAALAAA